MRDKKPGALGHHWVGPCLVYDQPWTREYVCSRCGYSRNMNYVLPEQTLMFLNTPSCDDHLVDQVMSA
jgi:hypothetical protein